MPYTSQDSILTYDCKLFKDHTIYLVINKKYEKITKAYIKSNDLNIKLIVSEYNNGSANTLGSVINELPNTPSLYIWSDLILSKVPNIENFGHLTPLIFTKNGNYRCKANYDDNNHIITSSNEINGNIPGIYYISEKTFEQQGNTTDLFDDLIQKYGDLNHLREYDGDILEFRDFDVYKKYIESYTSKNTTRYFNTITENKDGHLIKEVINKNYQHLISKEIDWYKELNLKNIDIIPKIYNITDTSIEMEKLNMVPIIDKINSKNIDKIIEIIKKAIEKLYTSNEFKYIDSLNIKEDIEIEFYKKTIDRFASIENLLDESVLRYKQDLITLIRKATDEIKEYSNNIDKYMFIHGDLNFSNILINESETKIKFIDPRAYFGFHKLYGLAEYDIAKIAYALSGYDKFNSELNYLFLNDLCYTVPKKIGDISLITNKYNKRIIQLMVALIWINLCSYISNNVFKCNICILEGYKKLVSLYR